MNPLFYAVVMLALSCSPAQADSLYRWVDAAGKVHYGDWPAEDAKIVEQKKFAAPVAAGDDDLPYGVRKAQQDFPLTLYVASNCADACVQARALLNRRGLHFVEKNLLTQHDIDSFRQQTGGRSVPSLTLGNTLLSGFEPLQWHNELDNAGYPQTPAFGTRASAAASAPTHVKTETEK